MEKEILNEALVSEGLKLLDEAFCHFVKVHDCERSSIIAHVLGGLLVLAKSI
jgi:hypothetical protein